MTKKAPSDRRLEEVIRHLDPTGRAKLWHGGPTVVAALRRVTPEVAAWRPYPDRHSIWALALHVAYWDYSVWRRLTDAPKGGFPRSPRNFPAVPDPATAEAWDEDRALVAEWQRRLVDALVDFEPGRLDDVADLGKRTSYADLVTGILMHDTYHAGQIQMLKRLAASAAATVTP